MRLIFFLITQILLISNICHSQNRIPSQSGVVSEEEILLDCSKKVLKKKGVSEIQYTEESNEEWNSQLNWPAIPPVLDTIFIGLTKMGNIKYKLIIKVENWPSADSNLHINDNGWRGYDTIYMNKECFQSYFCETINSEFCDSISFNQSKKIAYIKYFYSANIYNYYDAEGKVSEQHVRNNTPDGTTTYKIFYRYNSKKQINEITYYKIGKATKVQINDIFKDFSFDLFAKKEITYRKDGQVASIIEYLYDDLLKTFLQSIFKVYTYENGLLKIRKTMNAQTGDILYKENFGYKFYNK